MDSSCCYEYWLSLQEPNSSIVNRNVESYLPRLLLNGTYFFTLVMIDAGVCSSGQKSVYFLEFHPSLAIVSRLPAALKHAYLVSDTTVAKVTRAFSLRCNKFT